jgi:hypothetical protein
VRAAPGTAALAQGASGWDGTEGSGSALAAPSSGGKLAVRGGKTKRAQKEDELAAEFRVLRHSTKTPTELLRLNSKEWQLLLRSAMPELTADERKGLAAASDLFSLPRLDVEFHLDVGQK